MVSYYKTATWVFVGEISKRPSTSYIIFLRGLVVWFPKATGGVDNKGDISPFVTFY